MNSDFEIPIDVKVLKLLKSEPPSQAEYFLYGVAFIFTGVFEGTRQVNYLSSLYGIPGNIVEPPLKTTLVYIYFLTSKSHFLID